MSQSVAPHRPASCRNVSRHALLVGALALGLAACSEQKVASATAAPPARGDADLPEVLATIGGSEKITMADVRARIGDDLDQNENRYQLTKHKLVENTVRDILADRVLMAEAKQQGKTVDQLLEAEIGAPLEPSPVEIEAWYNENQQRVGGRPLALIQTQIANYLRTERRNDATDRLQARLNAEKGVKLNYAPFRLPIENVGSPAIGPESAPVTLVEFSDFECPFCGRFYPTLKRVEQEYMDRVRIVYRQFPLTSIHPNAAKAAEASLCANEQGKFWDMHDLLFQEQAAIAIKDLKLKAVRLGLDAKKFDECLDGGRMAAKVQEDTREGQRLGVTGTPALFINGVPVDGGAVSWPTMQKLLDKELAAVAKK